MSTMKKAFVLILPLLFIFTSCTTTVDGYSYSIQDARNREPHYYATYDNLFTAETDGGVVDFLFSGDDLHIIKFAYKTRNGDSLYRIVSKSTFSISESVEASQIRAEDNWVGTGKIPFRVEWLIAAKNPDKVQQGIDFVYDGVEYVLLYRIPK